MRIAFFIVIFVSNAHAVVTQRYQGPGPFDGFFGWLSSVAYHRSTKNTCEKLNREDLESLYKTCVEPPAALRNIAGLNDDLMNGLGETFFFDKINEELVRNQVCDLNELSALDSSPNARDTAHVSNTVQNIKRQRNTAMDLRDVSLDTKTFDRGERDSIVADFARKIEQMRPIHQKIKALQTRLGNRKAYKAKLTTQWDARAIAGTIRQGGLGRVKQKLNTEIADLERQINEQMELYAPLGASLWRIDSPEVNAFVDRLIQNQSVSLNDLGRLGESFQNEVVTPMKNRITGELRSSESKIKWRVSASDYPRSDKIKIVQAGWHKSYENMLRNSSEGSKFLASRSIDKLSCHLDSRYGEGAKQLENATTAGLVAASFMVGGIPLAAANLALFAQAAGDCSKKLSQIQFKDCNAQREAVNECRLLDNCRNQIHDLDLCEGKIARGCSANAIARRRDLPGCALGMALSAAPLGKTVKAGLKGLRGI